MIRLCLLVFHKQEKEVFMNELLTKAGIPVDGTVFIAKLIGEPFLSNALNKYIGRRYSLHIRPLFLTIIQEYTPVRGTGPRERITGELVLASAERVPVQIIGVEHIIPAPEAQELGLWRPDDEFFSISDTALTPEQAKQARYFVRPYPPGIVGRLLPE
jgi:hypothetical protein